MSTNEPTPARIGFADRIRKLIADLIRNAGRGRRDPIPVAAAGAAGPSGARHGDEGRDRLGWRLDPA